MGKLSQLEIEHRLRPLAHAIKPLEERVRSDHLRRVLTIEGKVRGDKIAGFVPWNAVTGSFDDGSIPAQAIGDGSVDDAHFALLAEVVGPIHVPVIARGAQTASDTTSTTSTTTYQQAITVDVALPAGTWTILAFGGASFTHSAAGSVDFYVEIAGSGALSRSVTVSATNFEAGIDTAFATGIAGGGNVTIRVVFRSNTAGTTAANSPWFCLVAVRTA